MGRGNRVEERAKRGTGIVIRCQERGWGKTGNENGNGAGISGTSWRPGKGESPGEPMRVALDEIPTSRGHGD